jgi:hypothetical protein
VPERDAYALALVAISPELGGSAGIGGVSAPVDEGAGGQYSGDRPGVIEAFLSSAGEGAVIALLVAAVAVFGAAIVLGGRGRRPRAPVVP